MNSRERILNVFEGRKVDRIPISLYEFDGHYDSWIYNYPEYVEILNYAKGKTDKMYFWFPTINSPSIFYGQIDPSDIKTETWEENDQFHTKTIIKTPLGEVYTHSRQDKGIHTSWTIENLCKDINDAKKILSLPYIPMKVNISSFFKKYKHLGVEGILMGDIPDALCLVVELFGFSRFLMFYIDNPDIIFKLINFFQERIYNYLKELLENGAITVYRICGPEYATPPYLNPNEFDKLVTPYDKQLFQLLHKYRAKGRLHSHGKIKNVLRSFLEIEIDATDPVEPPPDGDITLKEARKILGEKIVLIGNIEERLLEIGSKKDIEDAVKKAIDEVGNTPFILCPTAMPLTTPLDKKIKENIIHYIDCGGKYGKL